jgi:hypothetical protein
MNNTEHILMVWIITIVVVILTIFTISTLANYVRQKKKAALYLALNYIANALALSLLLVGHYDSYIAGITTSFYNDISMVAKIFIVLGILLNLLFHAQFVKVNRVWKYIREILGILLVIWLILPSNYTYGGRTTIIMTYMLMALYGLAINLFLAISFFKLAKLATSRRTELISLGLGAFSFLLYYFLMTIYGMTQSFLVMIITQFVLFISLLFYFIGIYLPKFQKE